MASNNSKMSAGVYLHIPFCKSRCSYCDFATDVYRSSDAVERYVAALCKEIAAFERVASLRTIEPVDRRVDTIYFGGGTPSLLSPQQVEAVLTAVRDTFSVDPDPEITMEM